MEESSNTQRTPYLFTSKELDEETGLYYYGARYYDPRTSVWQSADPILDKYLASGRKGNEEKLPGMGGVYNSPNLGLYSYGHLNPVRYTDPDGRATVSIDVSGKLLGIATRIKPLAGLPVEGAVGVGGSFTISFPTSPSDKSRFDIGFSVKKFASGGMSTSDTPSKKPTTRLEIGSATVGISASGGDLLGMEGRGKESTLNVFVGGANVQFDDRTGKPTGGGIQVGPGFEASSSVTDTEVFSARRGISRAAEATAEAVVKRIEQKASNVLREVLNPSPRVE